MASFSSEEMKLKLKLKQQQQLEVVEKEVDQLGRLPEEVVMMIINKLFNAKTLIRLSVAAKRYSALVSKTHTLLMVMDCTIEGASTPTPVYDSTPTFDEVISVITRRFNQIKRLHLHVRSDNPPRPAIPLGRGRFSQWVAVFGEMLEQVHFLGAASVVADARSGCVGLNNNNNNTEEEEEEDWDVYWSEIFQGATQNATCMHELIKRFVSKCQRLESVVFTNNCSGGGGALFMAKPHIARLKMFLIQHGEDNDGYEFRVAVSGFREPTLVLPRSGSGYKLKDVVFTSLISADTTGDKVMASASDCVAALDDINPDLDLDFDMDKWQLLLEAAHRIQKKEPKYAYTLHRCPFMMHN